MACRARGRADGRRPRALAGRGGVRRRLQYLAVPEDDIAILQALYPEASANPDLHWVIDRYVRLLRARMGEPGYAPLPALPDGFGEVGLHLFTFVHAAILPETLAYHRAHGVPDDISRATMADIGRHYVIERTERHRSGLNGGDKWLTFHARGLIYQLGRLQFERAPQGTGPAGDPGGGHPQRKGRSCPLGPHTRLHGAVPARSH